MFLPLRFKKKNSKDLYFKSIYVWCSCPFE